MARMISFLGTKKNKLTDEQLVDGLLNNRRIVINHFYSEIFPQVKALLVRMGAKEEEIKDTFQEGMVALWKNIQNQTYSRNSNAKLSSYLIEICKRRWLEDVRNKKSKSSLAIDQEGLSSHDPNVLDKWLKREELQDFQRLFGQLNVRCQEMLRRFYYEKESLRKMAGDFSLTEASVRNEKYRCMQRLKTIFQSQMP